MNTKKATCTYLFTTHTCKVNFRIAKQPKEMIIKML